LPKLSNVIRSATSLEQKKKPLVRRERCLSFGGGIALRSVWRNKEDLEASRGGHSWNAGNGNVVEMLYVAGNYRSKRGKGDGAMRLMGRLF